MNLFELGAQTSGPESTQAALEADYHLSKADIETFASLVTYLASTGFEDVTAGELAVYAGWTVEAMAPRLLGLENKGWVARGDLRDSRAAGEPQRRGYRALLPFSALMRVGQPP